MGKALGWMRKTRLGVRLLAILCCALVALSLVPVFSISFYNHSYYDDFSAGGQMTRAVWEDTHSVWALLTEAFSTSASSYENWEGNFIPNYLNSIQLGAISQDLCFAVTFVLVFALAMSWVYLCGALCDAMRAPPALRWLLAGLFVFLSVHFVPHPNEAFFWQSGGTKYTLGHVFLALLLGVTVKKAACAPVSKTREGLRTAGMCLCAVLCAGSNLMTGLGAAVGLCLYTVYVWCRRADRHVKLAMTLGTVSVLLGFAANVLAPGNTTRQSVAQMGSPVAAVMESITATVEYIGRWVTLPWIASLLILLPFLYAGAKGSGRTFRHPILMMIGSFAALAAQLAPTIYSGVYYDTGRIVNTMYLSFCLFMLVNAWYLAGYAARRREGKRNEAEEQTLSPAAALALALVLAVGCAGYGLTKMTGGAAVRALVTGQAARYDAAYRERMARLEDPAENPVTMQPLEDVPLVFMQENTYSWRAIMLTMGEFYGKEIVDGR